MGACFRLVIVLDELDYLGGQNEKARTDLLYRVLGWPSRFNGNVVVIGYDVSWYMIQFTVNF